MQKIIILAAILIGGAGIGVAGSFVWPHSDAPHSHGLHGQIIPQHSGGLDANGCHYDHKRGGYHCHR